MTTNNKTALIGARNMAYSLIERHIAMKRKGLGKSIDQLIDDNIKDLELIIEAVREMINQEDTVSLIDMSEVLKTFRSEVKNAYFNITFDPKTSKWVVSLPQARYRLRFTHEGLAEAIQQANGWIADNVKECDGRSKTMKYKV